MLLAEAWFFSLLSFLFPVHLLCIFYPATTVCHVIFSTFVSGLKLLVGEQIWCRSSGSRHVDASGLCAFSCDVVGRDITGLLANQSTVAFRVFPECIPGFVSWVPCGRDFIGAMLCIMFLFLRSCT